YPLPASCTASALAAVAPAPLAATRAGVATVVTERASLYGALAKMPGVRRAYRSDANFVLARFHDAQAAFDALLGAGIVVRDLRGAPGLGDALRISVGTPAQNAAVLAMLRTLRVAA
ncbi:MAG TPA: histidinol-phosphate transaminase, partial [Lysobacter sp.]